MKRVTRIYTANFNAHFSCGFFLSVRVTTCQLTGIDGAAHTLCVSFLTRVTTLSECVIVISGWCHSCVVCLVTSVPRKLDSVSCVRALRFVLGRPATCVVHSDVSWQWNDHRGQG